MIISLEIIKIWFENYSNLSMLIWYLIICKNFLILTLIRTILNITSFLYFYKAIFKDYTYYPYFRYFNKSKTIGSNFDLNTSKFFFKVIFSTIYNKPFYRHTYSFEKSFCHHGKLLKWYKKSKCLKILSLTLKCKHKKSEFK